MPKVTGKSLPVSTRCTPGWAFAFSTLISSTSACACGERKSFMCSMRGSTMSSAKRVWPVTLARPSTRRRGLPRTFIAHPARTLLDRFDDLLVAGAAAEIPGDRLIDALARGMRLVREQRLGGHQDPRRAVAALRSAKIGEGRLQRMQLGAAGEAFHRIDGATFAFERQHEAQELRLAVNEHRAGAAFAELATVLRAGQAEILAQHFQQR